MEQLCYYCMTPTMRGNVCTQCGKSASSREEARNSGLLIPGTELDEGSVVVGEKIGRGGFGITYRALDRETGNRVALKEFMPNHLVNRGADGKSVIVLSGEEDAYIQSRKSFSREAKILNELRHHPNIVRVLFTIEENNTVYYGMEFLDGVNVAEWVVRQNKGLISAADACKILLPAIDALIYCHKNHVLHRDISPDNILIAKSADGKETVKLIDFGAAHAAIENFTKTFPSVLKKHFSPIEQMTRGEDQGTWSDVYSLCATIYFLITGKPPTSALDVVTSNNARIEPPRKLGAKISEDAEDVLMHGLVQDYRKRIQTMDQFRKEFTTALGLKVPPYQDPYPYYKKTDQSEQKKEEKEIITPTIPETSDKNDPQKQETAHLESSTVQEFKLDPLPDPEPVPQPNEEVKRNVVGQFFLYLFQAAAAFAVATYAVKNGIFGYLVKSDAFGDIAFVNILVYTWILFALVTFCFVVTKHATLGMCTNGLIFKGKGNKPINVLQALLFSVLTTSPLGWLDGLLIAMKSKPLSAQICGLEEHSTVPVKMDSGKMITKPKAEPPVPVNPPVELQKEVKTKPSSINQQSSLPLSIHSGKLKESAKLIGIDGPMKGKTLIIHDKDLMGRNSEAVQVVVGSEDATVGRVHCQFHYARSNKKWGIINFSSNGVWINDRFIAKEEGKNRPQVIANNAVIRIGHSKYQFQQQE